MKQTSKFFDLIIDKILSRNMELLKQKAMDSGASDAKVISTDKVIIDPRVRFKCLIPKCYKSGVCEHCPPNGYSIEQAKEIVSSYNWAIFFRLEVPSSIIAAKGLDRLIIDHIIDEDGIAISLGMSYVTVFNIVSILKKESNLMGYSPFGFGAGNCHDALCYDQPVCQKMTRMNKCRNEELSCPSMEAAGIDAYTMAASVGWAVYPIGGSCEPKNIEKGSLMALVLIA